MNFGGILVGFVMIALIAAGLVFVAATQNVINTDTYGATYDETANLTTDVINTTTNAGAAGVGGAVIIIACLGIVMGIGMLFLYSRR